MRILHLAHALINDLVTETLRVFEPVKTKYLIIETMTESNRIEYKQELTDGLEKEVIAFLNYREGGIIYL